MTDSDRGSVVSSCETIVGIVIAGGRSRRMGTDKRWLRSVSGNTFLSIAINRLKSVCDSVWISGSVDDQMLRSLPPTRIIPDEVLDCGPMGGLISGLSTAADEGFAAVLCTPVDTPDLAIEDLRSLIQRYTQLSSGGQVAVVGYSDRVEPLIAIYPVQCLVPIRNAFSGGCRGLTAWLHKSKYEQVDLPLQRCRNINRPEDLC